MQTQVLERKFTYKDKNLPDIPGLTPEKILEYYSNAYPELINASAGEAEVKDDKLIYTISHTAGTKG